MTELELMDENLENPYIYRMEWMGALNYAFAQSSLPLIFSISFLNNTSETIEDFGIHISFSFDFIESFEQRFESLESSKILEIKPDFKVFSRKLFDLSEAVIDRMRVEIFQKDKLLVAQEYELPVFPMNKWSGMELFPESLACFVTPNIPQIAQIQMRASQILQKLSGDASISGYTTHDKNRVRQIMAAVYAAVSEQDIAYALPPSDFTAKGQLVRKPKEVLEYKTATCIEMAVLYAAVCESCGLNPFIVVIKGHAFAGVWLKEDFFDSNVVRDSAEILKRIADGINDLEVLECTCMNVGENKDFEQAVRMAKASLEKDFLAAIDIRRSHYFGLRPMPVKVLENGEVKLIDYGINEDATEQAKLTKTIEEYYLDTTKADQKTKSQIWLKNLLDLSKRNALISFKPGLKNIQIFNSGLCELEDSLSQGDVFDIRELVNDWTGTANRMKLVDVENEKDFVDKISLAELKAKRLRTFLEKEELEKTLKTIYRETKLSIEESGASSLFLAFGFLKWFDDKEPKDAEGKVKERLAPLVLVPVELVRNSSNQYSLRLREEDSQMNITLLEMLKQKFDLSINGLNPLPEDEAGIRLGMVFNSIRKAIMNRKGWDVVESAFLSNFSFSQFVMWNDLKNRFDRLTENKVVKAFVEGRFIDSRTDKLQAKELDSNYKVNELVIPSAIDSSQMVSVIDAVNGNSFVLHGPPGTGKSQTITNMIANALYRGQSVLFVAEKMAALNVVNERLHKIGLGDFCLELHSNKIQKSVVLQKFQHNFDLSLKGDSQDFIRKTSQIQSLKDELNSQVFELHKKRKTGLSVYELIEKIKGFKKGTIDFSLDEKVVSRFNRETFDEVLQLISSIDYSLKQSDFSVFNHPLKEFKAKSYSIEKQDKIREVLPRLQKELAYLSEYGNDDEMNLTALRDIYQVISKRKISLKLDESIWNLLLNSDFVLALGELADRLRTLEELREGIYQKYTGEIDNFDLKAVRFHYMTASNQWFFKKGKKKKALFELNSICCNHHEVTEENVQDCFNEIANWQTALFDADEKKKALPSLFYEVLEHSINQRDLLEDLLELILVSKNNMESLNMDESRMFQLIKRIQTTKVDDLVWNYENFLTDLNMLRETAGLEELDTDSENWKTDLKKQLDVWNGNLDLLKEWTVFYELLSRLEDYGFGNFIKELYSCESFFEVKESFVFSFYNALVKAYIRESDVLAKFLGSFTMEKIEQYNKLIDEYEVLSREEIKAKLFANLPDVNTCSDTEAKQIANLKRAIQSKGRGISIRSIFEENSQVIKRLTPCLLMSPLSVAQYIDLSFPKFDLVIFDEASQVQTGVAIGAMSRGENCIIVGDPNQLPPTSFFASNKLDEENLQVEDLESLLEDCLAVNMPENHLKCHYRSQNESLIAFSNRMYYANNMITFPSPYEIQSKVSLRKIDGIYDRGGTRTNLKEAEAMIEEVKKRLLSDQKDSIGIVTFNNAQQILIDDLLQKEFAKNRELEMKAREMHEPIFIKNLENVQGDERDVILFSISFGKDKEGKFYQNFGPIAKKGGWRRLNVAVSRSRKEMVVFSSISYDEIRLSSASSEGVRGIRKFLEYAQKGVEIFGTAIKKDKKNDAVIDSIASFIKKAGYECEVNVGSSSFHLSLAVLDPKDSNHYLTTILLDDKTYFNLDTARDRNRLIRDVLKGRNWNIYRLWTLDWFENRAREEERLLLYLNSLTEVTE